MEQLSLCPGLLQVTFQQGPERLQESLVTSQAMQNQEGTAEEMLDSEE